MMKTFLLFLVCVLSGFAFIYFSFKTFVLVLGADVSKLNILFNLLTLGVMSLSYYYFVKEVNLLENENY